MILLILGLILWCGAHYWVRLARASRAAAGDRGRMIVAIGVFAGVILMIIGYRSADATYYWGRSPATTGINNLLMVLAFYLYAASGTKARITQYIRHPQLTAVKLWAVAHLLVNGDTASFVLFGGLLVWAGSEVALINRSEPRPAPPHPIPVGKEIGAVVATVVVFGVVAGIHTWLGYYPFG